QGQGRDERLRAAHVDERERARRGVAVEGRHGVAEAAGRVDLCAVRGDDDGGGAVEPIDPTYSLLLRLDEGQGPGERVAAEDRHRTVANARDVDVEAVRTRHHLGGSRQSVDPGLSLFLHLDEGEGARGRVSAEYRDRLVGVRVRRVEAARDVDIGAVGAERDRMRAAETVDPADAVTSHLDE